MDTRLRVIGDPMNGVQRLRPLSAETIVDDPEIEAAKWMPQVEFVEQPFIQEDSMFKKIIDICMACLEKHYCGLTSHQMVSKCDGKLSSLYYNFINMEDIYQLYWQLN